MMAGNGGRTADLRTRDTAIRPLRFWTNHPALLLFFAALLVRLVYIAVLANRPGFAVPIVDEIDYDRLARRIANGFGFDPGPLFRAPLWPLLLGGAYKLIVPFFPVARLLNAILGALSVAVTYHVGVRLFDRRIAFAGALLCCLYGLLVHVNTTGLATSLVVLLGLLALLASLVARESRAWWWILVSGILWGLAALARPVALLPAGIIALDLFLSGTRTAAGGRVKSTLVFLLGLAAAIAPVTLRNVSEGDGVLISSNGGINLYLGNNEAATGFTAYHPELGIGWTPETAHRWAETQLGRSLQPSGVSRYYTRQALRFWALRPLRAALLMLRKTYLALSGAEISNNGDLDFFAGRNPMLRILLLLGFGVIGPFGLIGILLAWRIGPAQRLAALIALSWLAAMVLFFVSARYRLPAVPIIALFAVQGAVRIPAVVRDETSRLRRWLPLGGLILLSLLLNLNLAGLPRGGNPAYGWFLEGQVLAREGKAAEAVKAFRASLEENPRTPLAHQYIGELYMQLGRVREAAEEYRAELGLAPRSAVYRGLGLALRQLGQRDSAEMVFRAGLKLAPTDRELRSLLAQEIGEKGLIASDKGEWAGALEYFTEAGRVDPANPFYPFAAANALWAMGREEEAEMRIADLLRRAPDFPPARAWRDQGIRPDTTGGGSLLLPPSKPRYDPDRLR